MVSNDYTRIGENTPDPAFESCRLKSAAGWYVRVSWRHGQVEHVGGFASEDEAESWITKKSKGWLLNRAAALRRA